MLGFMAEENQRPSRRDMLLGGGAAFGGAALPQRRNRARRPNFVIIMTDGQRPDQFSIAGNPLIHTPNMDRIAREGMTFRNSFVTNALCAPARGTVLTGLYSRRNGVIDNKNRPIAEDVPLFTGLLHDAGYEVAFAGKSHIAGGLRNYYWDYYYGYLMQKPYYNAPMAEGIKGRIGPDHVVRGYSDDLITQGAAGWLEGRREQPFCLCLWLKAPHQPFLAPRKFAMALNDGTKIPKPATFDEDLKGYPGKPRAFAECDNKIGVDSTGVTTLEELVKTHYASTMGADDNVGRILNALESTGKLDDTVVMMTSDHGYFLGEWHFMDKRLMHEPSIRVPLMVRYPEMIKAGSANERMVLNLDLAPSVLDLAGVKVPPHMQGRSLRPLLEGQDPAQWRRDWFYAYYDFPGPNMVPKNRGIRTERYKLIEYWEQQPPQYEMYDLEKDPGELHNLADDPAHAGLRKELYGRMMQLGKEAGEV